MFPLVSVLVPAYNVEPFLKQCLDSIVNQTYRNLQVVVVDDGSTDDTWTIAQSFAENYCFVEALHQENKGVTLARKLLLSQVRGTYVLFVDGDDWIEIDMIERMLNLTTKSGADVTVCGNIRETPWGTTNMPFVSDYMNVEGKEKVIECLLHHKELNGSLCNKLVHSSFYKNISFNKDIWYGEDCIILWQALNNGVMKISFMPDCLYHYRMNSESITNVAFNYKKMSGHQMWKMICQQTKDIWPKSLCIAMGTFVQQDIMLLYYAAKADYKSDTLLSEIKKNVRENIHYMRKAGISNPRRLLLGYSLSYAYPIASYFVRLFIK